MVRIFDLPHHTMQRLDCQARFANQLQILLSRKYEKNIAILYKKVYNIV